MKRVIPMLLFASLIAFAQEASPDRKGLVDVGGRRLWMELEGHGDITVVFEAGGGNDSSVWAQLAPRIRATDVRTFVYDRAGLGHSELGPTPYTIQDEVQALRALWTACGLKGPIILAAHSYGGAISLLAASADPRVAGIVLMDAVIPGAAPKAEVDAILAKYRPQYDELRKQAPELAKAMIPLMEAMPATIQSLEATVIPEQLPILDIVAEETAINSPNTATLWRKAHAAFVAGHPSRRAVFAAGSSHKVMKDKPDLVVESIRRMIDTVRESPTAPR